MKIALVAPSPVPFTIGGAEKLWWGMLEHINQHTHHEAELIKVPSAERNFAEVIRSYYTFFNLDLSHFDCVISTKYPAWMVQHDNHICYLQHRLRGLYDTYHFTGLTTEPDWAVYPEALQALKPILSKEWPSRDDAEALFNQLLPVLEQPEMAEALAFPGPLTRAIIHCLDRVALNKKQIKAFFAISENVKQRQDYFPVGAPVQVIHHPSDLKRFDSTGYQGVFTVSRLDKAKRIHLLIEAFKQVKSERYFYIAGTGPDEEELKQLAGDDERIVFLGRQTDDEIIQYYSQALFVPFIPYDEDYGLITIEAMMSAKAVLTSEDAGGVNEFVRQHDERTQNGLSVPLTVEALAQAMQQMLDQPERTEQWGHNALNAVAHISWANTLKPLLEAAQNPTRLNQSLWPVSHWRPEVVIPSTFSIYPVCGGGQARMFHLYKGLAQYCNVTLLSLGYEQEDRILAPGLREIVIAPNAEHRAHLDRVYQALQADVEDIAAIEGILYNEFYMRRLSQLCEKADWLVASHPYLFRAIEACWQGPVLYDAHNVELLLKRAVLKDSGDKAEAYLQLLADVERDCYHNTALVFACSAQDLGHLAELYGERKGPEVVAANGVDCQAVPFVDLAERQRIRQALGMSAEHRPLLFVGSAHGPNVEAVLDMIDFARQLPEKIFWVVGSVCHHKTIKQIQERGEIPHNLHLFGLVSEYEKQRLMSAASLALNPMSSGSGSNLKMLDYGANGLPVLTTAFGNRGVDFEHRVTALVADKDRFVTTINQVLSEEERHLQSIAHNARALTVSGFDWLVVVEQLWSKIKQTKG